MTNLAERTMIEVSDGRSVQVLTAGPAEGLPLVFHTGTPAGLVEYPPLLAAAVGAGLRIVQYSRPGYGDSDPRPGRTVADAAADVAAVLDHLGADGFVTAGWSGGGPHALACAALLPGRCQAAATIAGVAPRDADGLDWLAGMAEENVAEFGAAAQGEAALTEFLRAAADELADVTGEQLAEALGGLVTPTDVAALRDGSADHMAASTRAALRTGIAGWRDDDLAFVAGWGFDVRAITVPVAVWQGDQDAMVPLAHGAWLAARIPGARAHLLPGEGHLTLVDARIGEILADLIAPGSPGSPHLGINQVLGS
jgi:pimeloyl-ACP methyl ester carboxylesterase